MREHKILITGTMGAGKTTAIAAISDIAPISTDVANSDRSVNKSTTTVSLDYGEVALPNGEKLRLYGTPGQERFSFMWSILAQGAMGVLILIDNSRPQPLDDLRIYLKGLGQMLSQVGCVVAVGRTEKHAHPTLDDFSALLEQHNILCPVMAADVRQREQVLGLLDVLLMQIEAKP